MDIIITILNIIQWVFFSYLLITTLYIFIFALAGLFKYKKPKPIDDKKRKYAVMIPGYKEDEVIVEVCEDALHQDYPKELYDVIAICDSYQPETIAALKKLPIKVVEVSFDKSTKSKVVVQSKYGGIDLD